MVAWAWRVVPAFRRGDWRSHLLAVAQIAVGVGAGLGILAMVTRDPYALTAFAAAQGLLILGVVLFAVIAVFAQRALVLEEFPPGVTIFREGDPGRYVYVLKTGTVEVVRRQASGGEEIIKRLGPGDHFGEMALLRHAPRNATVRTVTPVEVFKISPGQFVALYTALPELRTQFNALMETRLRELEGRSGRPRR